MANLKYKVYKKHRACRNQMITHITFNLEREQNASHGIFVALQMFFHHALFWFTHFSRFFIRYVENISLAHVRKVNRKKTCQANKTRKRKRRQYIFLKAVAST